MTPTFVQRGIAGLALAVLSGPAMPQTITGTAGSPAATTTLNGLQLPPPAPQFGG
jgi:arylsulfatase